MRHIKKKKPSQAAKRISNPNVLGWTWLGLFVYLGKEGGRWE